MTTKQMLAKIKEKIWEVEITRHWNHISPVMIGDTLNRLGKQCDIPVAKMIEVLWFDTGRNDAKIYFYYKAVSIREDKRKPIDDQSDECIKFVYDLLPKE